MGDRPLLVDVFCCAGGAGKGYHDAGFDVVGVDIEPQPNYPFDFIQADALGFLGQLTAGGDFEQVELANVAAIHASPPCQGYTTMNNRHGSDSPLLIGYVRDLLAATGKPYVIENVLGAKREMRSPVQLTGAQFGKRIHRPRLFETNWMLMSPPRATRHRDTVAVYGKNDGRRLWTRADGSDLMVASLEEARAEMGMPWATWDELREAIPPVYTEFIGGQLLALVQRTR